MMDNTEFNARKLKGKNHISLDSIASWALDLIEATLLDGIS